MSRAAAPWRYGDEGGHEGGAKTVDDIASEGYQAYHKVQDAGLAQEVLSGREHPVVDRV